MKKNTILIGSVALAILLAVTVIFVISSSKQKPKDSSLTGLVLNVKNQKAVENATVRIEDLETTTDKSGSFKLDGLSSGKYSIFVLAKGFKPYEFKSYELKEGINKIDGIMLEPDETKKDDKNSEIIPPPPLPGTKMDQKPGFKKITDFSNCTIVLSTGNSTAGNFSVVNYSYSNGIAKITNPQILDKTNPLGGEIYITKDRMIQHPSNEMGWIAIPKPVADPKAGKYAALETIPVMYIDILFKLISDKDTTVNFIGKVNKDYGTANKYYIVADADGNLFDGEVFTPAEGILKDMVIEFSGRFLINGQGDKTTLSVVNYKNTPEIDVPQNVKVMDAPKPPDIKFDPNQQKQPTPPKQTNP